MEHFNLERRFFGIDSYNLERLKNLCEKEFFKGELKLEYLGIHLEKRKEYSEEFELEILKLAVECDKKEKFHYCCKHIHELAANIFEAFKKLDKRYGAQVSHRFKIIKQDFNLAGMEIVNNN